MIFKIRKCHFFSTFFTANNIIGSGADSRLGKYGFDFEWHREKWESLQNLLKALASPRLSKFLKLITSCLHSISSFSRWLRVEYQTQTETYAILLNLKFSLKCSLQIYLSILQRQLATGKKASGGTNLILLNFWRQNSQRRQALFTFLFSSLNSTQFKFPCCGII